MSTLTPGNRLYLYRLLSRELGVGRQVNIAQAEQTIEADGINPADIDFDSTRSLLEDLSDFIEIVKFKKGNTYVIVHPVEAWDERLKTLTAQSANNSSPQRNAKRLGHARKANGRARPQNKGQGKSKGVIPSKPGAKQERARQKAQAQRESNTAEAKTPESAVFLSEKSEKVSEEVPPHTPEKVSPEEVSLEPVEPEPGEPESAASKEPQEPEPESPEEPQTKEPPAPVSPATEHIHLTVTYDPEQYNSELTESDDLAEPAAPAESPETTPADSTLPEPVAAAPAPTNDKPQPQPVDPLQGFPQNFSEEVYCKDGPMRILAQILPLGCDVAAVLDEDWRYARGAGTFEGTRSKATFRLRYLQPNTTTPITVTIKRAPSSSASGKRWQLVEVDGDDGTRGIHETADVLGAAHVDEGAWSDLSGDTAADTHGEMSPARELASFVVLGSRADLLEELASLAAPEPWDLPGPNGHLAILREYLNVTFHRLRMQNRIAISQDGSRAAIATGLLTSTTEDIVACLSQHEGDIPWRFEGFIARSETQTSHDANAPAAVRALPASYASDVVHESLDFGTEIALSPTLKAHGSTQLADALARTLRMVRANHRVATAAYDPRDDRLALLVPIAPRAGATPDRALALERNDTGSGYTGTSLLTLPRAYICARVVSSEQPSWLSRAVIPDSANE